MTRAAHTPEPAGPPLRAFLLTRSLGLGGAQRQIVQLLGCLNPESVSATLGVFYDEGELAAEAKALPSVSYLDLRKRGRHDLLGFAWRLARLLRRERFQVLYSFLTDANLLGLAAGRLAGVPVVWGVRDARAGAGRLPGLTPTQVATLSLHRRLAPLADLVIANSRAGVAGFPAGARCLVIPNGIDTARFRPDPEARARMRQALGLAAADVLVGLVGRDDPVKDIDGFLTACRLLSRRHPQARFLLAGQGLGPGGRAAAEAKRLGLAGKTLLLGPVPAPEEVYNALDLAASSSWSEGFPNTVAEALACGVPCVATRAGDTKLLVGQAGRLVTPGRPEEMAAALEGLLEAGAAERARLGGLGRARMVSEFSPQAMARRTEQALRSVTAGRL